MRELAASSYNNCIYHLDFLGVWLIYQVSDINQEENKYKQNLTSRNSVFFCIPIVSIMETYVLIVDVKVNIAEFTFYYGLNFNQL